MGNHENLSALRSVSIKFDALLNSSLLKSNMHERDVFVDVVLVIVDFSLSIFVSTGVFL